MSKLKRVEDAFLFLTLIFLPTQLGRHFWPSFSYIYSLPIDYLSPTIYFWDLLVVFLITTFLLQKKKFNPLAFNLFLIFILTQVVSLLPFTGSQINLGAGLVRVEQYLIAGLFGIYVASIKGQVSRVKLYTPLILAIVFESILAVAQFLKGGSLGFWILGERTFSISTPAIARFDYLGFVFLRPYATLPHPNVLAGFLLLSMLIIISYKAGKMFKVALILATITIFLTVSRAAVLILVILLLFTLGKKYPRQLIILFLVLTPILYTRFSSVINYDNLSLIRREELMGNALNYFLSSPFFGIGLNNFIPYISSELIAGPSKFLQPVHNIFLLALSETGILGFAGWAFLIGYPFFKNLKSQTCLPAGKVSNLKFIWLCIFILGLFDHYFLTLPQGYRLLFLIWGLFL